MVINKDIKSIQKLNKKKELNHIFDKINLRIIFF